MYSSKNLSGHLRFDDSGVFEASMEDDYWPGLIRTSRNTKLNVAKSGSEFPFYSGWWRPRADVLEEGSHVRVEFELPGVPKENINLSITDDCVTLSTLKPMSRKELQGYYFQSERHFGNFYRKVELPDNVDSSQASAVLENGVLKLTLPLLSESRARGRKIPIREQEKTFSNVEMSEVQQSPKMNEKHFEALLNLSEDTPFLSGDEVVTPEHSKVMESKDQTEKLEEVQEEPQKGHEEINKGSQTKIFPASDLIFAKVSDVHEKEEKKKEMPKLEDVEAEGVTQPSDTAESRSMLTPEESVKETPKEEQPPALGAKEEPEKLWPPISEKPDQSPEAKSHTEEQKEKEFTAAKTRRSKSEPPQPSTSV